LETKIKKMSFILFHMTECKYSQELLPIIRKIPSEIDFCKIGIINLSTHKDLIDQSLQSTTPLEMVPYMIFYLDGSPLVTYNGQHKFENIVNFINEVNDYVTKSYNNNNSQQQQQQQQQQVNSIMNPRTNANPNVCRIKNTSPNTEGVPLYGNKDSKSGYSNNLSAYKAQYTSE